MKLNLFDKVIAKENYPQREVDRKRIQELLDHPEQNDKFTVKDEVIQDKINHMRDYVDEIFTVINSLPIENVARLGVSLVIAGLKSSDETTFRNGINRLQEAFYGAKEDNS